MLPRKKIILKKQGFTLVELILVIIILGIIASVTLPKFASFKTNAINKMEDSVIASLKTAIQITHLSYAAMGYADSWPQDEPFSLLVQAPANKYYGGNWWETVTNATDNETWRWKWASGDVATFIFCPHWNGTNQGTGATKGNFWIYQSLVFGGWGHQPGDFWLFATGSQGAH